jgi:GNAT superfamily N-acetyltransferase
MDREAGRDIVIRQADAGDMPAVHGLVRQLAIYEKAEQEFTATIEDYRRDLEAGVFEVLLADTADGPVGMALYFMTYSTWKGRMLYLEDFVVSEPFRGQGIGRLLFDAFLQRARERGCRLVKWQVLDWNEPALQFYRKYDSIIEKEWWNGKIVFETGG